MKKLVIGLLVGIALTISTTIFAEEMMNMVGKKIDGTFPFKINGKKIDKDVVVIEGTSYIPVRAAADLFGYDIEFDDVKKEVNMQSKKYKGLSDFDKAKQNMSFLKLKSSLSLNLAEDTTENIFQFEGNTYIPIAPAFTHHLKYEPGSKTVTIEFNGYTIIEKNTEQYVKDIKLFQIDGTTYIKLSALGLKAHIDGDTLIIEKQ